MKMDRQLKARSNERWLARLYLISLCLDVLSILAAFAFANFLILGSVFGEPGKPHGLVLFGMVTPVYVALALQSGVYSPVLIDEPGTAVRHSLLALVKAVLLTLVIIYLGKIAYQLSRGTFIVGTLLSLVGLAGVRQWLARYIEVLIGAMPIQTTVICDGEPFDAAGHVLVVDARHQRVDPTQFDADMATQLSVAVQGAERVVVSCPSDRIKAWDVALKSLSARGEIIVPEFRGFSPAKLGEFQHHPTLIVAGGPLSFRDRLFKRLLDMTIAVIAIILLLPVLVVAAIAVRWSSPGPILFRQVRLGRDAKPFDIYKFRTMRNELADPQANQLARRGDVRVTPIGRFLRRTSIDELPQFFNVLIGDMSIVGPRPHAPAAKAADSLYWEVDDRYWARHCIKPGMTGLAQVRGHRGPTDAHEDLIDRLQSDLEYVTEWSIWRDIRIMAATLKVLVHDNAV